MLKLLTGIWQLAEIRLIRMFALFAAPTSALVKRLTTLTIITHVSCVPKKNTWYLFEGDFTAPSGNSSICKLKIWLLNMANKPQNNIDILQVVKVKLS